MMSNGDAVYAGARVGRCMCLVASEAMSGDHACRYSFFSDATDVVAAAAAASPLLPLQLLLRASFEFSCIRLCISLFSYSSCKENVPVSSPQVAAVSSCCSCEHTKLIPVTLIQRLTESVK